MKKQALFLLILLFTVACTVPTPTPAAEIPPTATVVVDPTKTAVLPTPTQSPVPPFTVEVQAGDVMFDFTAQFCAALWGNNGEFFDCPVAKLDSVSGVVQKVEKPVLAGDVFVNAPTLLTIPASGEYTGIFGRYPAYAVKYGDHFQAYLACLPAGGDCQVDFSLDYYQVDGTYVSMPFPEITVNSAVDSGPIPVLIDLSALSGQTVDFVLVVRNVVGENPGQPVWIYPHISKASP